MASMTGMARVLGFAASLFCAALVFPGLSAAAARAAPEAETVVVAFGDSLSAGYGLGPGESVPARLEAELTARGFPVRVINAGVSGDTTNGGLARLDWVLASVPGGRPALVIVELGANDALRGIDPALTRKNLNAILQVLTKRQIPVLLSGMVAPPNMGAEYGAAFNSIYPDLAAKYPVTYDPFFLEGVAAKPNLNQMDGMHPNAAGARLIAKRLAPIVSALLRHDDYVGLKP